MNRFRPPVPPFEIHIASAEDYLPIDEDHPQEYFQVYSRFFGAKRWSPAQKSASLKDHWFTLEGHYRAELFQEEFDNVELDGRILRRVTLKMPVAASRMVGSPFARSSWFPSPKSKGTPKMSSNSAPRPVIDQSTPLLFIQYASDTAQIEEDIRAMERDRDERLAQLQQETRASLAHLGKRFFLIGIFTFAGILLGGYLLLRLGLAPLARLSEAVSKISERNFQLQVEADKLPTELRPIADRLSQTLGLLQKAFAHEKQAAADISHELRTPLAALMTTFEVALRKKRTPDEYRAILEECRVSGEHMSHLVDRLMALARLDAGVERLSLEAVDVADLAQQCADMVRPLATKQGLTLKAHLPESIVTFTDPGKLREIVLNLLQNAIAYNKPHGSIGLGVERSGGQVCLEVRDSGIGIAPEDRDHLFERFFRADPSRHSDTPHCGLGLAIVKSYVDLLGGTIDVDSGPAGTTFFLRLPLRETEAPGPADLSAMVQVVGHS
jgi:signal transduction histidine kinase